MVSADRDGSGRFTGVCRQADAPQAVSAPGGADIEILVGEPGVLDFLNAEREALARIAERAPFRDRQGAVRLRFRLVLLAGNF